MKLFEYKNLMVQQKAPKRLVIFEYEDVNAKFIAEQYVNYVATYRKAIINYFDNIDDLINPVEDLFAVSTVDKNEYVKVLFIDKLEYQYEELLNMDNLFIITKKVESVDFYENYIIKVKKVLEWQIKDYIYSTGLGADTRALDWLLAVCKNDMYKVHTELQKIYIFKQKDRHELMKQFIEDGIFTDLSNYTIFNFILAIITKDTESIAKIYMDIDKLGLSVPGFITLVYQNLRNLILVKYNLSSSTQSLGLSDKQIYAINKTPLAFNLEQIQKAFQFVCDLDERFKSGQIDKDIVVDYTIVKIMSI